jgi:hypothetical protein
MPSVLCPKTSGYRVSDSANLFPQHCIALPYLHRTHIQELATKLKESLKNVTQQEQTLTVLPTLAQHLNAFISRNHLPTPTTTQLSVLPVEQRVTPIRSPQPTPLQRVTAVPATLLANSPTAPCILCTNPHTHQCKTRANTPGALPLINHAHRVPLLPLFTKGYEPISPPTTLPKTIASPNNQPASILPCSPGSTTSFLSAKRQSTT